MEKIFLMDIRKLDNESWIMNMEKRKMKRKLDGKMFTKMKRKLENENDSSLASTCSDDDIIIPTDGL